MARSTNGHFGVFKSLSILMAFALFLGTAMPSYAADADNLETTPSITNDDSNSSVVLSYIENETEKTKSYTDMSMLQNDVNALSNAETNVIIKLLKNVSLTDTLELKRDCTIDLNGFSCTANIDSFKSKRVLYINNKASVTVEDTSKDENGELAYTTETGYDGKTVNVGKGAEFTLNSGSISVDTNKYSNAPNSIYNNMGTVIVNGGSVTGYMINFRGDMNIHGGEIKAAAQTVTITDTGSLLIDGGRITNDVNDTVNINVTGSRAKREDGSPAVKILGGSIICNGSDSAAVCATSSVSSSILIGGQTELIGENGASGIKAVSDPGALCIQDSVKVTGDYAVKLLSGKASNKATVEGGYFKYNIAAFDPDSSIVSYPEGRRLSSTPIADGEYAGFYTLTDKAIITDQLNEMITKAKDIYEKGYDENASYTKATWDAFSNAYDTAVLVQNNNNASQSEVDSAVEKLENTYNQLGQKQSSIPNGIYSVQVKALNANGSGSSSASAPALKSDAILTVQNGTGTLRLSYQPMYIFGLWGAMNRLWIYNGGTAEECRTNMQNSGGKTEATYVSYYTYDHGNWKDVAGTGNISEYNENDRRPGTVDITLPYLKDEGNWIYAVVNVDAMEAIGMADPDVIIAIDYDSMKPLTSYSFGSSETQLTAGTYDLPISAEKAAHNGSSMMQGALNGNAKLVVDENGKAKVSVNLQGITVGSITDWAYNWKVYQSDNINGEKVDAEITGQDADGHVTQITFDLPDNSRDGVYVNMYVNAMRTEEDAYLKFDYAKASKESEEKTYTGTAHVDQFGEYDIDATVRVKDGKITGVDLSGKNFAGTYADYNKDTKLPQAINGMKDAFIGKSATDTSGIGSVDVVSGATYSSEKIKEAIYNALGLEKPEEVINVPTEKLKAGTYSVDIYYYTDVVEHSLVKEKKRTATLTVDKNGNATVTTDIINGTTQEPLFVLDFNGYYTDNDKAKALKTDAEVTKTALKDLADKDLKADENISDDTQVVTKISFPLEGDYAKEYLTETYLYVPAMKALNGNVAGLDFVNGKFKVNSILEVYWDSLKKTGDAPAEEVDKKDLQSAVEELDKLDSSKYTAASVKAYQDAVASAKAVLNKDDATQEEVDASLKAVQDAKAALKTKSSDKPSESTKTYSVPYKVVKETRPSEASMMNDAVDGNAVVTEKSDGTSTYTLTFKGKTIQTTNGHLRHLYIYQNGTSSAKTEADIASYWEDKDLEGKQATFPRTFTFTRSGKEESQIYVNVDVDAMDGYPQNAILVFDWASKTETSDTPDPTPSNDNKKDDTKAAASKFTDVSKDAFYYDALNWAVEKGVTAGTTATTFSPNEPTTRAQMVQFLYKMAGSPAVSGTMPFTDVKEGSYYYKAVLWAVQNGITAGTTATTFSPNEKCSRAQMAQFLYKFKGRNAKVSGTMPFTDVAEGKYYYNAVLWAYQNKVTAGIDDTTYGPNADCTRGEMVQFLYNIKDM